jgi:hypothetical protein
VQIDLQHGLIMINGCQRFPLQKLHRRESSGEIRQSSAREYMVDPSSPDTSMPLFGPFSTTPDGTEDWTGRIARGTPSLTAAACSCEVAYNKISIHAGQKIFRKAHTSGLSDPSCISRNVRLLRFSKPCIFISV